MEDALTEAPPPSRFFNEDLNNFTPPSPPLPSPFLVFSDPNQTYPLRPSLLIIAISSPSLHLLHHISSPSLHLLHHVSSKTLIGTLILPEISFSGNSIDPSHSPKDNRSCNIYSIDDDGRSVLLVLVQCSITAERSHAVAKLLINGDQICSEKVLIFDSVESRNFRGKLPPDETFGFKLETLEQRSVGSMVKGLDYFPSGSVIDGFGAALIARCQIRKIQGTLFVSWPQTGSSAVLLLKSILLRDVLPKIRLNDDVLEFDRSKDSRRFDSELYT